MHAKTSSESKVMPINIGIEEPDREAIAQGLTRLLADTYFLYVKTHGFHWNVTGPLFQTLHVMFEEQYREIWQAVDLIAERIRALGIFAPGSYSAFMNLTALKEADGVPSATMMIRQLVEDHETTARTARSAFTTAERVNDIASMDLLTERIEAHEKAGWMLRSLLVDEHQQQGSCDHD